MKYAGSAGTSSSNGGRRIAVFEAQHFDEGRLIIFFLFLGKSTLKPPVSYSVTKTIPKKKCEISSEWHFNSREKKRVYCDF